MGSMPPLKTKPGTITAKIEIAPWDTWATAAQHRPNLGPLDDDHRVDCSCGWHWNAKSDDARWDAWIAHVIEEHLSAVVGSTSGNDAVLVEAHHASWALKHG